MLVRLIEWWHSAAVIREDELRLGSFERKRRDVVHIFRVGGGVNNVVPPPPTWATS